MSVALVACAGSPGMQVSFREAETTAYSAEREALFRASADYFSQLVAQHSGALEEQGGFLRVPTGSETVWLSCAEVVAQACDEKAVAQARAATPIQARAGGVPYCPGDPRCPKRKSE